MKLKYTLMALAATTCASQAALTLLTGGDFDTGDGTGPTQVSAPWFEGNSTGGNYNDWITGAGEQAQQTGNSSGTLALSNANGWVYQSIGTRAGSTETFAIISGTYVTRTAGGGTNQTGNLTFDIYQNVGGAITAADGTDISGATLVGSASAAISGGAAGTNYTLSAIDLSGANATDELFLRISRGSVAQESYGENISVAFSTVPEPSSTALLGLGGLALILRRRK